jgi:hypothetical protein
MTAISAFPAVSTSTARTAPVRTPAILTAAITVYRFLDSVFIGAAYEPTRQSNSQLDQIRVPR